ncbi:MAG TPA: hypothetical protein VF600_11630 [Abditibacteriaceae bacterium]|jgi:hypothetical protein
MTQDLVTTNPQSDSALAQMDVFPDFAITLDEARRRIKMLQEFVRDQMVDGEDYGVIPGTGSKPTLLKPGAEKLNAIFGLAPIVEITNRMEDWDAGFVAYEVKVTLLNKRTTNVEAEGVGACNSRERKYKNQDAANIANTILKMAKKRALIDATLSATRASGLFTQDLEDMDLDRDATQRYDYVQVPSRNESNGNGSSHGASSGFTPARSNRGEYSNGNGVAADEANGAANGGNGVNREAGGNSNVLTEAQRGAILAIANKVFGRTTKEEMAKLVDKPISQLTKSEASSLIDRLRAMLPEQPQSGRDERNGNANVREYAENRNGSASRS